MKGSIERAGIVLVTAIYCVAMGLVSHTAAASNHRYISSTEQEKFQDDFSTKLLSQPSQSVNSILQYNNHSNPTFKSQVIGFGVLEQTTEYLYQSRFLQYTLFTTNLRINRRKSDLIFPFQYFW